jgi:hypothetical protein
MQRIQHGQDSVGTDSDVTITQSTNQRGLCKNSSPRGLCLEISNDEVVPETVHLHKRQATGKIGHGKIRAIGGLLTDWQDAEQRLELEPERPAWLHSERQELESERLAWLPSVLLLASLASLPSVLLELPSARRAQQLASLASRQGLRSARRAQQLASEASRQGLRSARRALQLASLA